MLVTEIYAETNVSLIKFESNKFFIYYVKLHFFSYMDKLSITRIEE